METINKIIAIDPGPTQSAYVVWDGKEISELSIIDNEVFVLALGAWPGEPFPMVIEQIRSYGMAVGMTIFDTVFWSGRFYEAWKGDCYLIPRLQVKQHICHDSRANDSNIRQALIDRFEPALMPRQRPKSVLKGLKKDLWSAAAIALTYWDQSEER